MREQRGRQALTQEKVTKPTAQPRAGEDKEAVGVVQAARALRGRVTTGCSMGKLTFCPPFFFPQKSLREQKK